MQSSAHLQHFLVYVGIFLFPTLSMCFLHMRSFFGKGTVPGGSSPKPARFHNKSFMFMIWALLFFLPSLPTVSGCIYETTGQRAPCWSTHPHCAVTAVSCAFGSTPNVVAKDCPYVMLSHCQIGMKVLTQSAANQNEFAIANAPRRQQIQKLASCSTRGVYITHLKGHSVLASNVRGHMPDVRILLHWSRC